MARKPRVEALETRRMFSIVNGPIPGDVNHDAIVNAQDIALVTSNWMTSGSGTLAGDANGDGIVNSQDLAEISAHWLAAAPTLTPPVATAGVAFTDVNVFHFTDSDPSSTAGNYSAVVTLGDGHTVTLTSTPSANGQIVAGNDSGFDVQLSYTYASVLSDKTFGVTVTDQGGGSADASVDDFSVGVGPPSMTVPSGPLTIKQTLDLPLSGMSVGDDSLLSSTSNVQLTITAEHGTIAFSTTVTNGLQSAQISQNDTGSVTITAPPAAINATLAAVNGVIYTPASGYSGSDTLATTLSDLGNTSAGIAQSVSQSVAINVATGAILPSDVSDLQLWLDPSDLSTLDLRSTAYLVGASQQYLHTAAGPSSYDFATNNKFSFAGWVYFNNENGDPFTATQTIIAQAETGGSNGVFSLSLSGSGYDSHLVFGVWTGKNSFASVYTATGPGGSPFVSGHDYFVAVSFDGSQATDGGKLSIWVDGTKLALQNPTNSVLPSTLQDDTASTDQLVLGNPFGTTNMSTRMEDWGVWDNVALNQTDVNSLWSGGAGLTITALSQLPNNTSAGGSDLQTPTMYWRLDESGGIRNDLSGNRWYLTPASDDGSYVGNKLQVISWTDKSGVLGAFVAGDGPQATLQMKRMREPTYDLNALGPGIAGVVFGQGQWLYNGVPNWMANSSTGAIFQNVLVNSSLASAEDFFLSSSADTDTTAGSERLFMPGYDGPSGDTAGVYAPVLRINDTAGNGTGLGNDKPHASIMTANYSTHTAFSGNYYMSPGELLSFEWADVGPAGAGGLAAGPWRNYINGAQQQLDVVDGGAGNAAGDWMELASGRSDQMLNGFYDVAGGYQSSTLTPGATTVYGDVVAYGVAPTDNDAAQLRSLMMQRVGITGLLSPLPQTVSTTATTYVTSTVVTATAATGNLVLPPVAAAHDDQVTIVYSGSGTATIQADQGSDILPSGATSGVASITLTAGQSATLVSDGTHWNVMAAVQSDMVATALDSGNSIEAATVSSDSASTEDSASATGDSADSVAAAIGLLTPAASSANVTPIDRLAAFVGRLEPADRSTAVDALMSRHAADGSSQFQHWTADHAALAPAAGTDLSNAEDAWTTADTTWASSLNDQAIVSIAAAARAKTS